MTVLLITSAYNEVQRIEPLVETVSAQTQLPARWILVSDGSSDGTDDLARAAADARPWMTFLRIDRDRTAVAGARVAPGKVAAIRAALAEAERIGLAYEHVAILDADVRLPEDYYERVLALFASDEQIGIAGGGAYNVYVDGEETDTGFVRPGFVGGPVQMFRRACYEAIGGYVPHGHEDVLAVAMAKMHGWRVVCDPSIRALHLDQERPRAGGKVKTLYRMGQSDYVMHGSLWFETVRAVRRMFSPPYLLAGIAQWVGFCVAALRRVPRVPIEPDLKRYLRQEERAKFRRAFGGGDASS